MKKDDKAKVRVFFGEIEGDNATIRDGLRSIAEAVNKTFQQDTRVVKVITVGGTPDAKQLTTELEQQIIDVEANSDESAESFELNTERQKSGSRSPRKAPTYSFVKDLNWRPEGKPSLRDFFSEKKPSSQEDIATVIIYYLHIILEHNGITANHIYSGMKELTSLGVRVPKDILQVVRNTAGRKGYLNASDSNALKTTTQGDNFVEHDLPNGKKHD